MFKNEYYKAVEILINEGLRSHQKHGILYDKEENIISFDPERVDPHSMELLP